MKNHVGVHAACTMGTGRPVRRTLLSTAILAALSTMTAQAQDAAPAPGQAASAPQQQAATPAPAPARNQVEKLDAVIVTGTARSSGLKKLDASFSITTATEEQIKDAAPSSAADLLKIVPGVTVETTGGQTGNNIAIRGFAATGDAPWVTIQLNGAVMYPQPTMSFFESSTMFRLDDTLERVEVLRGGSSPIFGDGQPGATVNYIMKKGRDEGEGSLRVTTGTGSTKRVDAFYGGKIAEGWYASLGGFFRTTQGVRDPQFPADRGGQFSAMLTRKLEDGELSFYGRTLQDKNTFYLPIPLQSSDNGRKLSSYPGFPAQTATFLGNELRQVAFQSGVGTPPTMTTFDMADGRGADIRLYGINLDKKLGGWTISNKANYMSGTVPTYAWFTGANPTTVDDFIAANLNGSTGGSATYVNNGGGAVAGSTTILSAGAWAVVKKLQSFTNDFRISREIAKDNTLTVGAWLADYSMSETWSLGNNFLFTLDPAGGRLINVNLSGNPAGDRVLTRNGQVSGAFAVQNNDFNGQNLALFIADEWKPTEQLRFDAGLRVERYRANGTWENSTARDLDGDANTLYNNGVAVLNGTRTTISRTDRKSAVTAGVNYYLRPDVSVFGRINSGYQFQHFNNLHDNVNNPQALKPATVKQYEVGLKTNTKLYSAFLTGFYNQFEGLNFLQILTTGPVNTTAGSKSRGIEGEFSVRPMQGLELALSGNYMKAHFTNYNLGLDSSGNPDNRTGNQVQRQPKLQFRFTPSYKFGTDFGQFKVFATYAYMGERFADDKNTQILPKYHTIDAGIVAHLNNGIDIRFTGTNLTNTIGITEGNTRVLGSATANNVFMGRPIFGRAYELSVGFNF